MTDFDSFHLASGECVLLAGRSGLSRLLKELGQRPDCALVSLRRPLFYRMNSRVEGALALLGLRPRVRPGQLGSVDHIKFCIALSLRRKVEVLLLDNPTRDLNPEERQVLFSALRDLARQTGMAVLFSSNDLTDALSIAHRVVALTPAGKIIESTPDTREDVLRAAYPLLTL